ncbi:MAG: histidine kinase, partial [Pricia sp.]|nr:histidine kinase [Pricia sp.]
TDLNAVVDQVLDNFSSTIENVQATIQRSNLPTLPAVPFQMRQVFSNLIGNSLKFVKENVPPKIEIKWEKVSNNDIRTMNLTENTPYFKITVTDNGIGFPKGMEKKIFEVFQRTHAKHEFEGTGIGLAIVRKIIDNHGGIITAIGNEGKGAVFVLYLPQ